ncbi:hypothetical protein SEA_BUDSKI_54 [Gordonia phage Budski]|nr:hypothetical protein SEA_BUDSKI_54 [Gordonia phage Budski]
MSAFEEKLRQDLVTYFKWDRDLTLEQATDAAEECMDDIKRTANRVRGTW